MITYRKKSLKVYNIYAIPPVAILYTHYVAAEFKKFVEKGEYSRIVDVFFYGENKSLVCSIIYEQALKREEND